MVWPLLSVNYWDIKSNGESSRTQRGCRFFLAFRETHTETHTQSKTYTWDGEAYISGKRETKKLAWSGFLGRRPGLLWVLTAGLAMKSAQKEPHTGQGNRCN